MLGQDRTFENSYEDFQTAIGKDTSSAVPPDFAAYDRSPRESNLLLKGDSHRLSRSLSIASPKFTQKPNDQHSSSPNMTDLKITTKGS